jgi:zinc resistance-associated protein
MWKMVLAGTTALAIAGGTFAYAQQGPGSGPGPRGPHWRPNAEDMGAFTDARVAALHAGLKLNAEQEKNWPAFESAVRDMAKQRQERFAARANAERPANPVERLNLMADAMQARGAALKKVADAAGPLYNSLDDAQKHRFVLLARMLRPHGGMGEFGEHRGAGGRGPDGRGPGWHRGMMGPDGPRGPDGPGEGPSRL